jgi:hypothetical protein
MVVNTTFLNGYLKENVCMSQLEGLAMKSHRHKVCKFINSLYHLKQAPHTWYEKLTEHLLKINFKNFTLDDATLFFKKLGKTIVYLVVYVDDILIAWKNEAYISSIKKELKKGFEVTNMGYLSQRGWIQWWKTRSFSPLGKVQFPRGLYLEPWGHLEVVVERVFSPKNTILNGIMTHAHISGSNPTPMSSKFLSNL